MDMSLKGLRANPEAKSAMLTEVSYTQIVPFLEQSRRRT